MCQQGKGISKDKRQICVIYANCQGQGIRHFLLRQLEFADRFEIHHIVNFELIRGKSPLPEVLLKAADLFIYQPLSDKYGRYASGSVLTMLPDRCSRISFPYIYNDAMWPFAPSGSGPKGQEILLNMRSRGRDDQEIVDAFCSLRLDCEFERRFEHSMSILRCHEQDTGVKVSHYILNEIMRKKLFLTQSHPTDHVFTHCVDQILSILGYKTLSPSPPFSNNDAGLPQQWPVTPYEMKHYGFTYLDQCDRDWQEFYSNEITNFLRQDPPRLHTPAAIAKWGASRRLPELRK